MTGIREQRTGIGRVSVSGGRASSAVPCLFRFGATRHGGEIMGMGDELGLVREGFLADLLLVDGDPLADLAILEDRARLLAIMKDGTFHKPPPARPGH